MSTKKDETRARVKAMREEQARADRRKERMMRFGIIGAVIAAIVLVVIAVQVSGGGDDASNAEPTNVSDAGGVVMAESSADAPVTMDIWLDFLCPHCATFENTNGAAVEEIAAAGDATVVYHPVSFTGGVASNRATNAWVCADEQGRGTDFMNAAFASSQRWENPALITLGESIGLDNSEFRDCVNSGQYTDWATEQNNAARDAGITGTPTVKIDGTDVPAEQWTPEGLQSAVDTASGGAEETAPETEPEPEATEDGANPAPTSRP